LEIRNIINATGYIQDIKETQNLEDLEKRIGEDTRDANAGHILNFASYNILLKFLVFDYYIKI
jgi:hypothetical protein